MMMTPIETTAVLRDHIPAGAHGVRVNERAIFIEGEGVIETTDYRELADWEVQQVTFVFPHLFSDMEEAYRREFEPGNRGAGEPGKI